ncbi:HTH-type transcriptional regulator YesS [Fundidesulfovibrio magnetotacticus]|uniref:HTH-type transcriptional regulator YesS n=1 Tax=Fundidesulfovibrio magnetotacticus TaxID=2730080 RepID=A0A6V8LYE9_9BACT|nr:AraC family transcriptional regulator [Fundidesulfovibrio magnetotacticus]GFK94677.1 HTH-type transcriptional regulator YesS [Fundidesulfovibrio magnetotacticus]
MERPAARVFRPGGLEGVECLAARGLKVRFARHFHEGYAVGVVEEGALGFRYLGRSCLARAGLVNLTAPGEVHDGRPACDAGWTYRMFYLEPRVLAEVAAELDEGAGRLPEFASGVLDDPTLAGGLAALHRDLEAGAATLLERQERLRALLAVWIARHAEPGPAPALAPGTRSGTALAVAPVPGQGPIPARQSRGREPGAVARARDFLRERAARPVSLEELAREAGLSPWRLTRAFTSAVGIAPHAYQLQLRVDQARGLLARGEPIANVAQACGFCDQSHLNRAFKRFTGLTPGQYAQGFARPAR